MRGEIITLQGSPLDDLVRLEDRGVDRQGCRRLWLHHCVAAGGGIRWTSLPEKAVAWPEATNCPSGERWPIWTVAAERLVGDPRHRQQPGPAPEVRQSTVHPIHLVWNKRGVVRRDPIRSVQELFSSVVGLPIIIAKNARGRPGDGGEKSYQASGRRPKPPEIEIDVVGLAVRGWLRDADGRLWTGCRDGTDGPCGRPGI